MHTLIHTHARWGDRGRSMRIYLLTRLFALSLSLSLSLAPPLCLLLSLTRSLALSLSRSLACSLAFSLALSLSLSFSLARSFSRSLARARARALPAEKLLQIHTGKTAANNVQQFVQRLSAPYVGQKHTGVNGTDSQVTADSNSRSSVGREIF